MKVAYIAEAWGKDEARQKMALVGKAGRELWHWSCLARTQVALVSNLVNWQPPRNRDPKPSEVQKEWPRLMHELTTADPDCIVAFGRLPAGYLVGESIDIAKYHGFIRLAGDVHFMGIDGDRSNLAGRPVFISYHPAAGLHQPQLYGYFVEDMRRLAHVINRLRHHDRVHSLRYGGIRMCLTCNDTEGLNVTNRHLGNNAAQSRYNSHPLGGCSCSSNTSSISQEVNAYTAHELEPCDWWDSLRGTSLCSIDTETAEDSPLCLTYSNSAGQAGLVYAK